MSAGSRPYRALVLTSTAMLAFAGNSILCRMALQQRSIDPASFTSIRLLSGALVLVLIVRAMNGRPAIREHGSWTSASMLFAYAICFSYAYINLSAGAGALILFGFVQGTMVAAALKSGERPIAFEWLGWLLACGGLVWMLLPGIEAPPVGGAVLMALSGVAWGIYSIRGRAEPDVLGATCSNFVLSIIFVTVLAAVTFRSADISNRGLLLAILSGALTSGVGYVIWYAALDYLRAMQAALVQLSVPALAAAGGIVFLGEPLSLRLLAAGLLILGGIAVSLVSSQRRQR